MAESADIPKPSAEQAKLESAAGTLQQQSQKTKGQLSPNINDVVATMRQLERQGKKVERNTQAIMNYLKEGDGSELSADVLVAMAAIMAGLPKKKKEKKKRLRDLYFKWARASTTVLITKVIDAFRPKKEP